MNSTFAIVGLVTVVAILAIALVADTVLPDVSTVWAPVVKIFSLKEPSPTVHVMLYL
jgi:hypothetical protein